MSLNLVCGETYRHKTMHTLFIFRFIDLNYMYHFSLIKYIGNSDCMFGKDWVDMYLEPNCITNTGNVILPSNTPYPYSINLPAGDIHIPFSTGSSNVSGSLAKREGYTSLGEVSIVEPKIVHSTCRTCHQVGSHNIVNHKEYYYCRNCKREC